jgi:hypothetical protein
VSDAKVVAACKKSWNESWLPGLVNSDNCSGFFKSVARNLNMRDVPDVQADDLAEYFRTFWLTLKSDTPGVEARQKARDGHLVVAALKSDEHSPERKQGHVAVIVDGDLYHSKYPTCWCGSTGAAQSQGELSVGEVWNRKDRDKVGYYIYATKFLT